MLSKKLDRQQLVILRPKPEHLNIKLKHYSHSIFHFQETFTLLFAKKVKGSSTILVPITFLDNLAFVLVKLNYFFFIFNVLPFFILNKFA